MDPYLHWLFHRPAHHGRPRQAIATEQVLEHVLQGRFCLLAYLICPMLSRTPPGPSVALPGSPFFPRPLLVLPIPVHGGMAHTALGSEALPAGDLDLHEGHAGQAFVHEGPLLMIQQQPGRLPLQMQALMQCLRTK